MGALMNDALGIGLAATQVGVLHRVLVYRVEHDSPVNALVNPVLEWSGGDKETMEEGCLSLPGVHVDVERPTHVRVRAQDAERRADPRRGHGPRGARHPARDGPPRRDPHPRAHVARPAQGGHADPPRAPRGGLRTAFLGTSAFAAAVLGRLAATDHRPALVVTRPDRAAGRGRKLTPPPGGDRRPRARPRAVAAGVGQHARGGRARGRVGRGGRRRVRLRCAHQGAAADGLRDPQRPSVAAAALARGGARRARDHGRRRADRSGDHAPHGGARLRAGLPHAGRADRARRRLRHARRAPAGRGGDAARARARRAPALRRAVRGGRHLRREDHRRRPHAGPRRAGGGQRPHRARAAPPHRRAPARSRTAPSSASTGHASARTARSSCSRSSRRAGGRWPTPTTCAATRRAEAARGRRPTRCAAPRGTRWRGRSAGRRRRRAR